MTFTGRLATLIVMLVVSVLTYSHFNKSQAIDVSNVKYITELPIPIVEAESVLIPINEEEFECMRANIYYEARNQKTDAAFIAVGYIVMNRVGKHDYPETLCGVIKEKRFSSKKKRWVCQFSWFCDGKSDVPQFTIKQRLKTKSGKFITRIVPNQKEIDAWNKAGELAIAVMRKQVDNPIGDATMYHATYVRPNWDFNKLTQVAKIESHIFYQLKV